ncbi:MAG TPA: hypothetical protein PLH39_10430, partial [Promineifilum sp.]|nr:hypothetical protein [Promineifilum sp.]
MPLLPGERLHNRYRVVSLLASGPYGAVYRAYDAADRRSVAIKEYQQADDAVAVVETFAGEKG